MRKSTTAKALIVTRVTLGSLLVGTVAGTVFAATTGGAPVLVVAQSINPVDAFPLTESGQTYGFVDQGLTKDPNARAELVLVTTDDGVEGWAYFRELQPAVFAKTTEEAVRLSTDAPYAVAVYKEDGKTLVGYQTVNRPSAK